MEFCRYPVIDVAATGRRICALRKKKGLRVIDVSRFMGFSEPQAVYKWQRGECLPSVDNLFALSRLLETSMEDILVEDTGVSSFILRILNQRYNDRKLRRCIIKPGISF